MLDSLRAAVAVTAIAGCLACAACGGSSAGDRAPAGAPSVEKTAGAGGVSAATAIASRCVAANASDPGQFTVCLARHGLKLPDSGAVTACIHRAHDVQALQACLTKGVR